MTKGGLFWLIVLLLLIGGGLYYFVQGSPLGHGATDQGVMKALDQQKRDQQLRNASTSDAAEMELSE